jgi:murein DD-endopeptidase MepM/ murein hydrolase activator NlpD
LNTFQNITHPRTKPIFLVSASAHSPLQGWPVSGRLSQAFGCSQYYTGIRGPNCEASQPWFHDGLDLAAWPGGPVRATLTGTVTFAGADDAGPRCGEHQGYGLGVVIDNGNNWQVLFAHLAEVEVVIGQQVEPDTIIGVVGDTGCTSGPHLHFSLKHNGRLVDPLKYLPELGATTQ